MRVNNARIHPEGLLLQVDDLEAKRFVYDFKPGDYELKKTAGKRSLTANAYAWVLIDKIAEALRRDKTQVYRDAIRDIGGVSSTVCVQEKAVEKMKKMWESGGLGWQTDVIDSKLPGCKNMILYYGSSAYDTKQMSRFLDHLVQDARSIGIETRPQEEIDSLLKEWNA